MKQIVLPVVAVLVVLGLMVIATLPSTSLEADHYVRFQDGKSLYALLAGSVQSGDSIEDVEELLGPGIPMPEGVEEHRGKLRERAVWVPDQFPHGVYASDTFVTWPVEDQAVVLQFRRGTLVNHNQHLFSKWHPHQDVGGRDDPYSVSSRAVESQAGIGGRVE